MRLLYISSYYKPAYVYGGPVRSISQMCETLAQLGVDVTVLTTDANGAERLGVQVGTPISVEGVNVIYYPVIPIPPRSFFYSPQLALACINNIKNYDIVIMEGFFSHAMASAVKGSQLAHVPYILSLRGQLFPWAFQRRRYRKEIYMSIAGRKYINRADAIHCTSQDEADWLAKIGIKTRTFVVPNGIDVNRFDGVPRKKDLHRRANISVNDPTLLFLGRLHHIKQPELAVQTLALVKHKIERVQLVFSGADEENLRPRLETLAITLGCAENIHFTGLLAPNDVIQALHDADMLFMPSEHESFGMAALEALSAGLAVVATDTIPVARWAEEAGAARRVASNPEAFARVIVDLLSNPRELAEMGMRGRDLARKEFDTRAVGLGMLTNLNQIVVSHRARSENQHLRTGAKPNG